MALSKEYKSMLDNAVKAIHERTFFAQYPEHPKAYGEDAPAEGMARYEALLGKNYEGLQQGEPERWVGSEVSPYTRKKLNIKYPWYNIDTLINNAQEAMKSWKKVSVDDRAAILVDSLEKIKDRFYDIAYATMHTTGQPFVMSFQASGPHSNDRALEALALGYEELKRFPQEVLWEKPMGKFSVKLEKTFTAVPKGIGLVIGCSTFPVWNSVPGIYASLITGCPVLVKPHPKSILAIAIVVEEIQKALSDAGYDPNTVQLAVDTPGKPITKHLAKRDEVKVIDYTGGSKFGKYVESLKGKSVFTEKAGVNSVILDSINDPKLTFQNLAFSVSLYSGQMCTAPQNFFVPKGGITTAEGKMSFNEVVDALKQNIAGIAGHPKMSAGTLGAVQNDATLNRTKNVGLLGGKQVLEPTEVENTEFPKARTTSPTVIVVDSKELSVYERELFGPIVMVVKTKDTDESLSIAKSLAAEHGAITCAAYATDANVAEKIQDEMESVFVPVTFNLEGPIWVNQHAAFSDFHVTSGNPAGNASFTNPDFINRRFVWVGHRRLAN